MNFHSVVCSSGVVVVLIYIYIYIYIYNIYRSERFVDSNTKNGKTSVMQDYNKLYTILSKGEHTHFIWNVLEQKL